MFKEFVGISIIYAVPIFESHIIALCLQHRCMSVDNIHSHAVGPMCYVRSTMLRHVDMGYLVN